MIGLFCFLLAVLGSPFKSKLRLEAENAVLRHQLIVLRRRLHGRVRLTNQDRWFLVRPRARLKAAGRPAGAMLQLVRAVLPTRRSTLRRRARCPLPPSLVRARVHALRSGQAERPGRGPRSPCQRCAVPARRAPRAHSRACLPAPRGVLNAHLAPQWTAPTRAPSAGREEAQPLGPWTPERAGKLP